MWRSQAALTAQEAETLAFVQKLGVARKELPAMRRGRYKSLMNTSEDTLVFGRVIDGGGGAAIVGLTRSGGAQTVSFETAQALGIGAGTVLTDRIGGSQTTVGGDGRVTVTIPARSAVVLAP
jgi:hypothetical protein